MFKYILNFIALVALKTEIGKVNFNTIKEAVLDVAKGKLVSNDSKRNAVVKYIRSKGIDIPDAILNKALEVIFVWLKYYGK